MAALNQRNLSIIVLKLTAIMGITWILGLVLASVSTQLLIWNIHSSYSTVFKVSTVRIKNALRTIDFVHI